MSSCVCACVQGRWELTPVAVRAGKLLARRLFGGSNTLMNYEMVCVCVRAYVRTCVRVCVHVRAYVCACVCKHAALTDCVLMGLNKFL